MLVAGTIGLLLLCIFFNDFTGNMSQMCALYLGFLFVEFPIKENKKYQMDFPVSFAMSQYLLIEKKQTLFWGLASSNDDKNSPIMTMNWVFATIKKALAYAPLAPHLWTNNTHKWLPQQPFGLCSTMLCNTQMQKRFLRFFQ